MKRKYKVDYGVYLVFAGTKEFVEAIKEKAKSGGLETSTDYMQIIKRNSKMGRILERYFLRKVV